MRLLVTGSRWATQARHSEQIARHIIRATEESSELGPHTLVEGACVNGGVDRISYMLAVEWNKSLPAPYRWVLERHPAAKFSSPLERNEHMVSLGAHMCLAFPMPGPRARSGTWHCFARAVMAGIPTWVYPLEG